MKKLIASVTVVSILIGVLSGVSKEAFDVDFSGFSASAETTYSCGKYVTATLSDDGVFTVSGIGEMYGYDNMCFFNSYGGYYYKTPWYNERSLIKSVVVEEGVTSIGQGTFYGLINLESITIPESVTSIKEDAFHGTTLSADEAGLQYADKWIVRGLSTLTSLEFDDNTKGIADGAFSGHDSIRKIVMPKGLEVIGENAFSDCTSLLGVILNDSLETIGAGAFSGCSVLMDIKIPDSVTSIGAKAFLNCSNMTAANIPNKVTEISNDLFNGCTMLEEIVLPNVVTTIGDNAFCYCENLKTINFPNALSSIGSYAFSGTAVEDVVIHDKISNIGDYAFSNCSLLRNIIIGKSITKINETIFNGLYDDNTLENIAIYNENCDIYGSNITIPKNAAIYGYKYSTAQVYAETYDREFIDLEERQITLPVQTEPVVTTITTTVTTTATNISETTEISAGDANGDNKLDVRDCAYIASMLASGTGDKLPKTSDFNGDGVVNVRDAAAIAKKLAEKNL